MADSFFSYLCSLIKITNTMKRIIFTFCLCMLFGLQSFSQFHNNPKNMDTLSGISCDSGNIFWAINVGGAIDRFSLTGNIVTNFGVYLYNCPGNSLAYCNNLNGNGYSPTFY